MALIFIGSLAYTRIYKYTCMVTMPDRLYGGVRA